MAIENPLIPSLLLGALFVLVSGIILRFFKQPSIIAYILTGIVIGPGGFGFISDINAITIIGEIGVILLLFFIGMEISITKLFANWKIAVFGTLFQVILSIAFASFAGMLFGWSLGTIVLIGFIVSLSSTAVLIKILEDRNQFNTKLGQNILSILIVQDIIIVPMLAIISFFGPEKVSAYEIILQLSGTVLFIAIAYIYLFRRNIRMPFSRFFKSDPELQVFASFIACFGLSALASLFHLSSALGAFLAGMIISRSEDTKWIQESLHSFRVIFIALFFVSVGLLIDARFLGMNLKVIMILVSVVLVSNTLINAVVFRWFKENWKESLFSASMLAPIGEFSFIIASAGLKLGLMNGIFYQFAIGTIGITLFLSPLWISMFNKLLSSRNKILCC